MWNVEQADLVVAMRQNQLRAIQADHPKDSSKVFLLTVIAQKQVEVQDPYGQSKQSYAEGTDLLRILFADGYAAILDRLGVSGPCLLGRQRGDCWKSQRSSGQSHSLVSIRPLGRKSSAD